LLARCFRVPVFSGFDLSWKTGGCRKLALKGCRCVPCSHPLFCGAFWGCPTLDGLGPPGPALTHETTCGDQHYSKPESAPPAAVLGGDRLFTGSLDRDSGLASAGLVGDCNRSFPARRLLVRFPRNMAGEDSGARDVVSVRRISHSNARPTG
jgi:hypothetical protein